MNTKEYNKELKNNWRPRWLSSINELTSLELQKKSWLEPKVRNSHWSFIEFMCKYFDDLAVDDNYRDPLQRGLLTNQEFEIIQEWHEELCNYDSPENDDNDHDAILNDPSWLKILKLVLIAKSVLTKTLNELEKEILIEEIKYLE
jgi:hypothetical protein